MTNLQPRGHFSGKTRFNFRAFSAPDISLGEGERSGADVYADLLVDRDVVERHPVGVSATRAALRNSRGEASGAVREVTLDWESIPGGSGAENIEIVGPKDGRPIIVRMPAGFPSLVAVSGCVVIVAGSSATRMTVRENATALVFAERGKVSLTAEPGSVVDFYAASGVRGYQRVEDGALFTAHGDLSQVRLSTDPDPMFEGFAAEVAEREALRAL
jgi:hypothetical protein